MKQKIVYITSVCMAFLVGMAVTYIAVTKQQMDALLTPKPSAPVSGLKAQSCAEEDKAEQIADIKKNASVMAHADQLIDEKKEQNISKLGVHDYSEEQAKQVLDSMPDVVLGQYIDKFIAKGASEVIVDKRRFAKRAIEELYQPQDNQPLVGTIKVSFNQQVPDNSQNTSRVSKFAKIYAHLDTYGKAPNSPFVFVKWINNQTGQVLLFEKKNVIASKNQNWVSFVPYDGWEVGSYDIRFYQFNSELQPIAQTTYSIYEVAE